MVANPVTLRIEPMTVADLAAIHEIERASFTAPCAPSSSCFGTTRWSASGIERWKILVARFTAPQSTT